MGLLEKPHSITAMEHPAHLCVAADGALFHGVLSTIATVFQIISSFPLEGQKGPG